MRRALGMQEERTSVLFGRRLIDGVMFPLLLLTLAYVARALLLERLPMAAFKVAIPVLVSLVVIRVGVKVLQVAFATAPWVRVLERTISWVAWLAMVLWVSGLLPVVMSRSSMNIASLPLDSPGWIPASIKSVGLPERLSSWLQRRSLKPICGSGQQCRKRLRVLALLMMAVS